MVKVIGAATVLVDRMGDAPMCRSAPTGHWIAVQGGRDAGVHAISFPPHRVSSLTQNEPEYK